MIDLHCHVLPGLDDGPSTLDDSLALCRAAHADGTRTIVATPHLNWDYPDVHAAEVHARVATVNAALVAAGIDLTIRAGAEVGLSRAADVSDGELGALRLGGGPYVLLEVPWRAGAAGVVNALRAFASRGYGIVLAHPERSPVLQRNQELVHDLVEAGALCCLSTRSLGERADRQTRSAAWELLAARLAHVIASDSHDSVQRPPELRSGLERAGLSTPQIDYFTRVAPEAIIDGLVLPVPPLVNLGRGRRWPRRT